MPLCELALPPETEQKEAVYSHLHGLVSRGLGIPDPKDWEIRLVYNQGQPPTLSILFTVGPNEYPDFPDQKAFFPSHEAIRETGETLLEYTAEALPSVGEVKIEAWKDTTFILREQGEENRVPQAPSNFKSMQEVVKYINGPVVTLWLSPKKYAQFNTSLSAQEGEPRKENSPFQEVVKKIYRLTTETLGLANNLNGELAVKVAKEADTDISVEIDCQPREGHSIPQPLREYLAKTIISLLDTEKSTEKGSAEIWVRQGSPETFVFSPSKTPNG